VFDLTVDGCHEFLANGLIVANCLGYWAWHNRYRFEEVESAPARSYLDLVERAQLVVPLHRQEDPSTETVIQQPGGFLGQCRGSCNPPSRRVISLLREAR